MKRFTCFFLAAVALTGFGVGRCSAQYEITKHIPDDVISSITLRPAQIKSHERLSLLPFEIATGFGMEYIGIDLMKIQRADLLIGPSGFQPSLGLVVQTPEAVTLEQLGEVFIDLDQFEEIDGVTYYALQDGPPVMLSQIDDQTWLLATQDMGPLIHDRGSSDSVVALEMATADEALPDASAVVDMAAIRPMLAGVLPFMTQGAPPVFADNIPVLVESIDTLNVSVQLKESNKITVEALCEDDQIAEEVGTAFADVVGGSQRLAMQELRQEFDPNSQTQMATLSYLNRLQVEFDDEFKPVVNGSSVKMETVLSAEAILASSGVGLLVRAVQQARGAARRVGDQNNIRQFSLAMLNFESAYGQLPSAAIVDEDSGKPLLSWRVAVLPYLEEGELFSQFHLDEPWDSEHNIELLDQMPEIFKSAASDESNKTRFLAVVGEDTFIALDESLELRFITDGMSLTTWIIQAPEEMAVPWTAPQDFDPAQDELKEKLFPTEDSELIVGMGDGSVHTLSAWIDIDTLKALFTRNGGEIVDWDDF